VVLVGASTAVAENYRPIKPTGERAELRRRFGLNPDVPIALATRSLSLNPGIALFAQPGTIVYTSERADPDARRALAEVADVVVCGDRDVDLSAVRADLGARGLTRTLCEGGPTLFSAMAAAGAVDELCLSISPLLTGPGAIRIVSGDPWTVQRDGLDLIGLLEEDNALFARYRTSQR
jgi:riboflavin biosynthesis pyrimidine reductase